MLTYGSSDILLLLNSITDVVAVWSNIVLKVLCLKVLCGARSCWWYVFIWPQLLLPISCQWWSRWCPDIMSLRKNGVLMEQGVVLMPMSLWAQLLLRISCLHSVYQGSCWYGTRPRCMSQQILRINCPHKTRWGLILTLKISRLQIHGTNCFRRYPVSMERPTLLDGTSWYCWFSVNMWIEAVLLVSYKAIYC